MMDETEGESRYVTNYDSNQGFGSTQRPKGLVRNVPHPHSHQIADNYVDEDEEELEEEQEEQEVDGGDNEMNCGIQQNGVDDDDGDGDGDDDDGDDDDDDDDDDGENHSRSDNFNLHRHPKKRKLKSLLSSFEFAPRLPAPPPPPQPPPPPPAAASTAKLSFGGRNTLTDWSEHETFVLLDSWGERFLQRGRKSLRSEEWQEVADKVSQESKIERTDTQCRNRLDTLKKKYKKEKSSLESSRNQTTKWVYFKKMDMLMSSTTIQQSGLSCGVDSGEYVFMNPTVYLNHANGLDEMRDSPGNTDSQEGDDDSDPLPLKRSKEKGNGIRINGGSFRLLADSINKFSEIYEKIENGKRKQMVELEKMRMEFHKELELQKRQILDRARDEIAKIRQGDYEENDSAENISG